VPPAGSPLYFRLRWKARRDLEPVTLARQLAEATEERRRPDGADAKGE
jgi:hypothetical protein